LEIDVATWTIDEDFARAHAAALRDLASVALEYELTMEKPAPVSCRNLEALAEAFEGATKQPARERS
jgi:hypothetical protein